MHYSALQAQIVKVYGQLLHITASFYYFHTIYWLSRCLHTEATQIKEKQFFFCKYHIWNAIYNAVAVTRKSLRLKNS